MPSAAQERTLAHLMQENPALLGLWCDFYTRFAVCMAHSANSDENQGNADFFAAMGTALQPHNVHKLLAHTQTLTALPHAWQFLPLQPVQQVALLPVDAVVRICLFAALSIHYKTLSKLIVKKDVLALHQCVGQDAWYFGLRKAALYKADVLEHLFQTQDDVVAQLTYTSACVLDFCLSAVPAPLSAHLDFVVSGCERRACPALDHAQTQVLQHVLCRIARHDVPTPWKELF